jgi:Xaa-Pro aminopeptidase
MATFEHRLSRLAEDMAGLGVDALALMPSTNLRYFTGLTFHPGKRLTLAFFAPGSGRFALVLPALEALAVREGLPKHLAARLSLHTWTDAEGYSDALEAALRHVVAGRERLRVGVENLVMRVMELRALETTGREIGCAVEAVDATPLLSALRMVKDEEEIAALTEAARIIEAALTRTVERIRPGMTERQLAAFCANAILEEGGEGESFESFVGIGPNTANPHHLVSDRPCQPGDLVLIDCGAVYHGYASDITRTFALGEPVERMRKIYDVVQRANAAGREAARAGRTGEEIDRAARAIIEVAGYGKDFPHRLGHGLGLEVNPCHEPPDLVAGSREPLPAGTVVTIEPGIYLSGVGGVRIEDMVLLTEDGSRCLTSYPRDLTILPVA